MFTQEQIQKVWEKAIIDGNNDPNVYRKDECGAWIARNEYGNRYSSYGWEIDRIKPGSNDDGDELLNLRPLMWENNQSRSDGRMVCVITAEDQRNVRIMGQLLKTE